MAPNKITVATTKIYQRKAAVSRARSYWNKVCADGFICLDPGEKGEPPKLPARAITTKKGERLNFVKVPLSTGFIHYQGCYVTDPETNDEELMPWKPGIMYYWRDLRTPGFRPISTPDDKPPGEPTYYGHYRELGIGELWEREYAFVPEQEANKIEWPGTRPEKAFPGFDPSYKADGKTGVQMEYLILGDCTHFISFCIGAFPPRAPGGGRLPLDLDYPSGPYGLVSPEHLLAFLLKDVNRLKEYKLKIPHGPFAVERDKVEDLLEGDVIGYLKENDRVHHLALLVDAVNGIVACHTYARSVKVDGCSWDNNWELGHSPGRHRFFHITA